MLGILLIHSSLLSNLLCNLGAGLWTALWAPLPSGFQLRLAGGRPWWEIRQVETEQGQSMHCLPHYLVTVVRPCLLDKDHSSYLVALSMQLSFQGLALPCLFRFRGRNGFTYLRVLKYPLFIFLNPAHRFVNSPFIKLFSNYPVFTCHLFLTYSVWITVHHGPGIQVRWINLLLKKILLWVIGHLFSYSWKMILPSLSTEANAFINHIFGL